MKIWRSWNFDFTDYLSLKIEFQIFMKLCKEDLLVHTFQSAERIFDIYRVYQKMYTKLIKRNLNLIVLINNM